jgi:glycosyltransferase involved in cell wall biosynthesis
MKIIFLIDTMETRGGMERVTAILASGLANRGIQIEVLTLRGDHSAYALAPDVTLASLGLPPGHLKVNRTILQYVRAIRAHLRRSKPDVLVTVDTFLSVFAFPAAIGLGIRRMAWEHFNFHFDFGMRTRRFGRWVAAFLGHQVITLTEHDTATWKRAFPRARARILSITNPLSFAPRSVNPYQHTNKTVLAVGWLDHRKGYDLLLEAWAKVEPAFPDWSLRIIGSGPEESRLRVQGDRLGLKRWTIAAQTDQIEQEYLSAGVFCLSSRSEGLPMVLIESQAYGVPAVAFDCPTGPAELLRPGGGLLIAPEDIQAFAQALQQVMGDQQVRTNLSNKGFEAKVRHDPERVFEAWSVLTAQGT